MSEPFIEVGLVLDAESVTVRLDGEFVDINGSVVAAGEYRVDAAGERVRCGGIEAVELRWLPVEFDRCEFALEATIGVQFHWQQQEVQTFAGGVRFVATGNKLTVINDVPLETYLTSVICSEMSATSPADLVKAHSVVSRSWLLAQCAARAAGKGPPVAADSDGEELIRWYDREGHPNFDVCADDHCQRYHGTGRIHTGTAYDAIGVTRGQVLVFDGQVCDARYAKACGGVTEDFRAAWSEEEVPYLVPFVDGAEPAMPDPPLTDEAALRRFVEARPDVYCNCTDAGVLDQVLTSFDRETQDFFRWQVRLTVEEASRLVEEKLGLGLGRILALEPVERGLSGRLVRLRVVGEGGRRVIGKELEIRRALSPSHLYSSAFVVDTEGPSQRPDAFVLSGAGWGHGVGLCQIGAAVMASRGVGYEDILRHYYPSTALERAYE